jgi:predicted nuclease with TOPRIM domain
MNFSFYIFGTPGRNFDQFCRDDNEKIFKHFVQNRYADSQMALHKNGHLTYYAYIRYLSENNYLGFCLIFNGIYCVDIRNLFELFDKIYSDIALNGELLKLDNAGKIRFVTDKFVNKSQEIERVNSLIKRSIDDHFTKSFIPFENLKVGNGTKCIPINEANDDIVNNIQNYDIIYITKTEQSDSEFDRINKQLSKLYSEKQDLNLKYIKLQAQKKNYKIVLLLCFLVIACILILTFLNKTLQNKDSRINSLNLELTQKKDTITNLHKNFIVLKNAQQEVEEKNLYLTTEIERKNSTITEKESYIQELADKIEVLNDEISSQEKSINTYEAENEKLKTNKSQLEKQVNQLSVFPLIIKSIKVGNMYSDGRIETNYGDRLQSSTSMYLKPQIEYIGLKKNETVTLYIKLYANGILSTGKTSPTGYSISNNITISDEGTAAFSGWGNEKKGNWAKGNYRYEIWYDNMCLKAVDFTIY